MKTKIAGLAVLTLAVGLFAGAAVAAAVDDRSPASAAVDMQAACTEHMADTTAMLEMMGGQGMMGGPGMMGGAGAGHESHHSAPVTGSDQ